MNKSTNTKIKALLYNEFKRQGITRRELAKRLGVHDYQVDRIFNPEIGSSLDQLDRMAQGLNKALVVDLRDLD